MQALTAIYSANIGLSQTFTMLTILEVNFAWEKLLRGAEDEEAEGSTCCHTKHDNSCTTLGPAGWRTKSCTLFSDLHTSA